MSHCDHGFGRCPVCDAGVPCPECNGLRARLVNIYHLTLTGQDPAATVRAVRAASGPGAPAPAPAPPASDLDVELIDHGPWIKRKEPDA
jgi:hypothetical protein